ncbi:hypothetical protein AAVH_25637 [Aphelenchoides avenae]|nr:hypothetical protein AAVH_25637 [Aphelenchus avenae]
MENVSDPAMQLKTPEKQQQQDCGSAAPQNGTAATMPTGVKNPDEMPYLRQCREILTNETLNTTTAAPASAPPAACRRATTSAMVCKNVCEWVT